jgi:putative flippase GtrA
MKKVDIILSLLIGELTAVYFVVAFSELVPSFLLPFYRLGLPILFPILSLLVVWLSFLIGKKFEVIFQIVKYLFSGALATVSDLTLLNFLVSLTGKTTGIHFSLFKSISFIFATLIKFFVSKFWTFEKFEKEKTLLETIQFFGVTLIGLVINVGVASVLVNYVSSPQGISEKLWVNIASIIAAFSSFAWNFIGYKFIVFKK